MKEVQLKIRIGDDGTLGIVAKEAKGAADSVDKLGASAKTTGEHANTTQRRLKGLSQQSSNTTKNFSKMAQGMSGTLVPAYAILASNVFALSAAFTFFKRASDVKNLEQSQISFAENTGVALGSITQRLRDASDGMLGFKEAGQAAAIGLAKGFSPSQLEALAEGARKASTALGRDFEDSFDRLVRGASKAEPELLDELGITLRLEEATDRYAKAIGKNRNELNSFQRSQAVLIETQRQLNENFGDVEAATNPFVKLGKTLEDIIKSVTQFFLPMFEGLASIMNASAGAAVAAFGLLAFSIFKAIVPMIGIEEGLNNIKNNSKEKLDAASQAVDNYKQSLVEARQSVEQLRAEGGRDLQSSAGLAASDSKSPTLQRAAAGTMKGPDAANLKKAIASAEKQYKTHGKIVTGIFKGKDIEVVNSMKAATVKMNAQTLSMGKVIKVTFTKAKLHAKVFFATLQKGSSIAFAAVGRGAQKMGSLIDKAMSFAGVVGVILLVKNMVMGLYAAPATLMLGFAKAMDSIVNVVFMGINMIMPSVLGITDSFIDGFNSVKTIFNKFINFVATGLMTLIETVINGYIILGNEGIKIINKFRDEPIKLIDPVELSHLGKVMDETEAAASNLAGSTALLNTEGSNMEDSLRATSVYDLARAHEDLHDAVKLSTSALEKFNNQTDKMQESLYNILDGIELETDAVKRNRMAFEGLASLDVAGQYAKIYAQQTKVEKAQDGSIKRTKTFIMSEEDRATALENLKVQLTDITKISPKMGEALQAAIGDGKSLENMENLGILITDTAMHLKFFESSLSTTKTAVVDSLAGGDMKAALAALDELKGAAVGAGEGLDELRGTDTQLSAMAKRFNDMFGEDGPKADALAESIRDLMAATHDLAVATEMANSVTGFAKTLLDSMNAATEISIKLKRLEIEMSTGVTDLREKEIDQEKELLNIKLKKIHADKLQSALKAGQEFGASSIGAVSDTASANVLSFNAAYDKSISDLKARLEDLTEGSKEFKAVTEQIAALEAVEFANKLGVGLVGAAQSMKALGEEFAKLGPDGEYMSAVANGFGDIIGGIGTAITAMTDTTLSGLDKVKIVLNVVSGIIGAVGSISAASSKERVKGIDKEIEAEKKRDGKSAASVAKLKQLEAKKTAEQKKAFEMKKKISIAQTVISTATAAMGAYQSLSAIPLVGPALAAAAAGMIVAMGMKQVSMISSTSFQGGGSMSGGGATGVSVGARGNSVDISKSKGAGGELGYLRGEQGIGGAENFRGAATGYRNRNYGGNTGFMVGEQGPELFMPDRAGTIMPADDSENFGGGASNVNFSINAIDAAGVEEVLIAQQGNIIGMLRSAANSYGESFFEGIDESVYTTPSGAGRA